MINKKDLELKLLLRESHIQQLKLKNNQLQQRIDKAINYINEVWNTFDLPMGTKIIVRTIDKFLQGSDKDEN